MIDTLTHTIGTAGRLAILSREELERLDAAALEVLAEVGVSIPSEKARGGTRGAGRHGRRRASPCRRSSCAGWLTWRRRA